MGYLRQFASVFLWIMLCASSAAAGEVRMNAYAYDYGTTARNFHDRDVFVLCENCPQVGRLALKPKISLAVRAAEVSIPNKAEHPEKTEKLEIQAQKEKAVPVTRVTIPTKSNWLEPKCIPPVYFRFNRSDLSGYEKDQLGRLVSYLKERSARESLKLRVTGYTCKLGKRAYNDRLSLLRAKYVSDYLQQSGFKVIEVRGEGHSHPVSKIRKLNRRVVIEIIQQEGTSQSEKTAFHRNGPVSMHNSLPGAGERHEAYVPEATYDNVIFCGTAEKTNYNSFYVASSRIKSDFSLITNNLGIFSERAVIELQKTSTLDYFLGRQPEKMDAQMKHFNPLSESERKEFLAAVTERFGHLEPSKDQLLKCAAVEAYEKNLGTRDQKAGMQNAKSATGIEQQEGPKFHPDLTKEVELER